MAVVYVAGGCLWGVEAFFTTIPGIIHTEAGRANGRSSKMVMLNVSNFISMIVC
ncbi:Peptide methionine sulfoxide reductase MsrA [Staphylococcus aureus]|nr:Peptide methionine sulfoxide reductase MsrA [Staphylococcus aureus]SBC64991.1 Peptide methionine sulfoxide reductase MsrA [Staphylococcus aureus]SBC96002.1 Peptide methionine sulfoxide reductase MsrA [Staphylococcus aureus]